jgi:hypothetical protein
LPKAGSHNWTARALTGSNIEASLKVHLHRTSPLYVDAVAFLESVRGNCEPFDVNAVDYYKWLQRTNQEEEFLVLELRGSPSVLDDTPNLTVYGGGSDDQYRALKRVDTNIVISLMEQATGREFLYEAAIRQSGYLSDAGVDFQERLYAQKKKDERRPRLRGPEVPSGDVLKESSWWASVALIESLVGESAEPLKVKRWIPDDRSRIPRELRSWFPAPDRPLVQRPIPRSVYNGGEAILDGAPAAAALTDGTGLLRRKIVRAKRRSGQPFTLRKAKRQPLRHPPQE